MPKKPKHKFPPRNGKSPTPAPEIDCDQAVVETSLPALESRKPAPALISYSVAQELQAHPDRFDIVRDNPNLTKRDARRIMRDWKQLDQRPDRTVAWVRRWWTSYLKRHIELIKEGRSLDGVASDIIRQAIEPTTLGTPIRSIAASQKIVDRVRDAHDETPDDEAVYDERPPDETVERDPLGRDTQRRGARPIGRGAK